MNPTHSYKISDSMFLIQQGLSKVAEVKPVEVQTHHLAVIDCSGSMSGDLPKIREQLKRKLPKMLKEGDTISIVWFSGRGEFGTLLKAEPVATLADLREVNNAIDRWLRPVGLTGFKEPLEEVSRLVDEVSKTHKSKVWSLFFMSDGCDNQWSRPDILKAVEKASGELSSATFVEYGYYADRPLLTAMAEKAGGNLIFAQNFNSYEPQFEAAMQKRPMGGKRVEVQISGDPIGAFVWAMANGELTTFGLEGDKVSIPEGLSQVWYLSPKQVRETLHDGTPLDTVAELMSKKTSDHLGVAAAYAAVSLFSVRMKPDVVYPLLKALGDVKFIEDFSSCFGKQKYSTFMDAAKAAAFDPALRWTKGWDPNKVPKDDAYTVLDLLQLLASDEENRVLVDDPNFTYSPIGRGRVDSSDLMTDDELDEIKTLTAQMAGEKNSKKLKELNEKIASITASKKTPLQFVADEAQDGYSISSLTFNEDRPNVSFLVRKSGTVDLSSRLPEGFKGTKIGSVPEKFSTFIFRNYTVVKDGLVNLDTLPVKLSQATAEKFLELTREGVIPESVDLGNINQGDFRVVLNLKALPIINRKMVKAISARVLFEKEWELTKARAAQKVWNSYKKEKVQGKKSETYDALYGSEASAWLKEQGFTDYSGFSPKSVQAESKDFYLSKELRASIKGFSSLPSLNEFRKQAQKGKFTVSAEIMKPYVEEAEAFLASDVYSRASNQEALFETWVDGKSKEATQKVRGLLFEMAQQKFSIVVGQTWPTEFKSLDENTMPLVLDGQKLECKLETKEAEIKI